MTLKTHWVVYNHLNDCGNLYKSMCFTCLIDAILTEINSNKMKLKTSVRILHMYILPHTWKPFLLDFF